MSPDIEGRIFDRLETIRDDIAEIKRQLQKLNGSVQQNSQDIAVLKVTTLRIDAMRVGAVIGGVAVVVGALLKLAGVF